MLTIYLFCLRTKIDIVEMLLKEPGTLRIITAFAWRLSYNLHVGDQTIFLKVLDMSWVYILEKSKGKF